MESGRILKFRLYEYKQVLFLADLEIFLKSRDLSTHLLFRAAEHEIPLELLHSEVGDLEGLVHTAAVGIQAGASERMVMHGYEHAVCRKPHIGLNGLETCSFCQSDGFQRVFSCSHISHVHATVSYEHPLLRSILHASCKHQSEQDKCI